MKSKFTPILFLSVVTACMFGCKDDPKEEFTYLTATPKELVFDADNAAANVITVKSNSSWSVTVSDTQLRLSTLGADAGETEVRVNSIPEGATYTATFETDNTGADGKKVSATVSISRAAAAQTLNVTPACLTFNDSNSSANTFTIVTNAPWTATPDNQSVALDKTSGEAGSVQVKVTDMPELSEHTITVATQPRFSGDKTCSVNVTVKREKKFVPETVYYEDFGNSGAMYATAFTGWNKSGSGASTVTYGFWTKAKIQNDNYGSSGRYTGASGGNYYRTYYDDGLGYLAVSGITLPAGVVNYTLSLGTEFTSTEGDIALSPDGKSWTSLTFTAGSNYGYWGAVTINFTLEKAVDKLYIRFMPKNVTAKYGLNVDDVKLVTNNVAGQSVRFEPRTYRWAELPATESNSNYAYNTYWSTTVLSGQSVRNFSYCYDTRRHNPIWVAYPLHECYREGGYGRTTPDPWHKAPDLDESKQSIIYPYTTGTQFQYWTFTNLSSGSIWGRGHLCRSADRGGADTELNIQTFVPTNTAPQTGEKFASLWGDGEALVSGGGSYTSQICADTLYVVAGCYYANDNMTEYDASYDVNHSAVSKPCVMPTHQFKLLLRTRSGNSGKPIQECTASELKAIGFWFDTITSESDTRTLKDCAKSISEIEALTGLTFFPDIPATVKSSCTLSDWGLQ